MWKKGESYCSSEQSTQKRVYTKDTASVSPPLSMSQVYVGNLDPSVTPADVEREFQPYGDVRSVRFFRRPPGGYAYAFVEFKDRGDALYAIRAWDGKYGWRVELSRNSRSLSFTTAGRRGGAGRLCCYNCGEPGHFARDCLSAFDNKKKGVKPYQRGGGRIRKKDKTKSTCAWKPVPPPPPPWMDLPEDLMGKILKKLRPTDILENAQKVCTAWRKICKDPAMWRVIDMSNLNLNLLEDEDMEMMCRHAVDLSQGQLAEISIEYFATNELLDYIARRSSQLKCIRLIRCCFDISTEGLTRALKELPHLEELHLQFTPILGEVIESVGRSCPLLKSFTLIDRGHKNALAECDNEAFAVAKTMPELRRLILFGNNMTNEGLQAILDGCLKLESLDIRHCFKVEFGGELGKRCLEQIKDLRRPNDPIQDCEWKYEVPGWTCGEADYDFGFFDDFDYDYDDEYIEYDDFCDPYLLSSGSEDSDYEAVFGFY